MQKIGVAIVVAVVAIAVALALPTRTETVDETYRIWTWNVMGWTAHRGSTTDGLIEVSTDSIRDRGSQLVALNELCHQQYQAIRSRLVKLEWPEDPTNFARFEPQLAARNGAGAPCGGKALGVAIFSQQPLGRATRVTLPSTGGAEERHKLLCAPLRARQHLRFCVTQLTADGIEESERQLSRVLGRLEKFDKAGDTVLLAGDLNVQPHDGRLDGWYASSLHTPYNGENTGAYRELDDTDKACPGYGESTTEDSEARGPCGQDAKTEMIFIRRNRISGNYDADALPVSKGCATGTRRCSDHRILTGSATVVVKP